MEAISVGLPFTSGARVAALARPSEVLLNRAVVDLVAGSDVRFERRGSYALQGVTGRWSVFAVAAVNRDDFEH